MADEYKTFSNSFGQVVTVTSTGDGVAFGFTASHVRVANEGPVPVHYTLASTNAASTSDPRLAPGEAVDVRLPAAGAGFKTTSTSTSDNAAPKARVSAFRG